MKRSFVTPRLSWWARLFAGLCGAGALVAAVVALFGRDWLSAFILFDLAFLAGFGAWTGRDSVARPDA
ncbi:MAG: hypothetical protein ACREMY_30320 [bacterium]